MLRFLLAFALMAGVVNISHAQVIYVKVQPVDPVYTRPVQPSPAHVWIGGEYAVHENSYQWRPGYWALPPQGRRAWVRGRWSTRPGAGYYWKPGYWR